VGNLFSGFGLRNLLATSAVRPPVPVALPAMIAAVARHKGHIVTSWIIRLVSDESRITCNTVFTNVL
jgi:hypothetical protein